MINPNNPTGAVYPEDVLLGIAELARRHQLIVMSDEIYDKILYGDATHTLDRGARARPASASPSTACPRPTGSPGSGPGGSRCPARRSTPAATSRASTSSPTCGCAPTSPPSTRSRWRSGGYQSISELILPGGRLVEQRDAAWEGLNAIPGVSCTKPDGALYLFPRLDPTVYDIRDDERFALDLLREQKLLVVHGTGFNWATPDHFRIVFLPRVEELEDAVGRIEKFLATYTQ